jgi:hypothetical protein
MLATLLEKGREDCAGVFRLEVTKDGDKLKRERSTDMSDEKNTPQENEDKDETDVEGHLLNSTTADSTNIDKPDVEGHMYDPNSTTVDSTTVD